jgi:hypothetical protein
MEQVLRIIEIIEGTSEEKPHKRLINMASRPLAQN